MQAQREAPLDMQCKDKFLLQSAVASPGATTKDITPELFNKESGNRVEECKLKVNYVDPPQPPSPVREGSEEGSSPRASVSDNGTINTTDSAVRLFDLYLLFCIIQTSRPWFYTMQLILVIGPHVNYQCHISVPIYH
ncbi:putative major sperm protein (MSP) [Helianthus annuus]|nr:putative major sperm protein (MSP) [Helianthus annuus]KAJ0672987.1 putative major sperm protein (MSP) [Helianthus annuus]